jgi:hypothetical protein
MARPGRPQAEESRLLFQAAALGCRLVFFLYQKEISLVTIDRHQAGCLFLALLYDREKQKGNANRATLAAARNVVQRTVAG